MSTQHVGTKIYLKQRQTLKRGGIITVTFHEMVENPSDKPNVYLRVLRMDVRFLHFAVMKP
jgi:hypothetical protein